MSAIMPTYFEKVFNYYARKIERDVRRTLPREMRLLEHVLVRNFTCSRGPHFGGTRFAKALKDPSLRGALVVETRSAYARYGYGVDAHLTFSSHLLTSWNMGESGYKLTATVKRLPTEQPEATKSVHAYDRDSPKPYSGTAGLRGAQSDPKESGLSARMMYLAQGGPPWREPEPPVPNPASKFEYDTAPYSSCLAYVSGLTRIACNTEVKEQAAAMHAEAGDLLIWWARRRFQNLDPSMRQTMVIEGQKLLLEAQHLRGGATRPSSRGRGASRPIATKRRS